MILANKITVIRILAVPAVVIFLLYYTTECNYFRYLALGIFSVAVLTDVFDGFVARRKNQQSELGTYLDPIADKLLLVASFISLSTLDNIPPELTIPGWATLLVISRDGIILIGAALIYVLKGNFKITPTIWGKLTTFFQMLTIITVLCGFIYWEIILYITLGVTVISGADYIRKGNRLLV